MVNTRRMETSGSAPDNVPRYHTRRTTQVSSSSNNDTESEDSEKNFLSETQPSRLRSGRFNQSNLKYTRIAVHQASKSLTLDESRSLRVYSRRKMHDDLEIYTNDSDDEMYSRSHNRITRKLRHRKAEDRRSALSLRPLSLKSYADSPMTYNSADSDGENIRRVRKSTRKRTLRYENMSWLQDDQMHKMGYPNLDSREYSEEDSREAQEHVNTRRVEEGRSSSRRNLENGLPTRREIKQNKKYLFDYDTEMLNTTRRRARNDDNNTSERTLRSRRDSHDKENKETFQVNVRMRRRLRSEKEENTEDEEEHVPQIKTRTRTKQLKEESEREQEKEIENADEEKPDSNDNEMEVHEKNENNQVKEGLEGEEEESSESEDEKQRLPRQTRRNVRLKNNFSTRSTQNGKMVRESSSSETGPGRVYSLRDRAPKQVPSIHPDREIKNYSRRRYNRRRNASNSSSSSSSSDSDDRCRKPKYNKNSKSAHSKNELLKSGAGGNKLIPIGPETIDVNVKFSSVGGLDDHVQCLKEMVILPMMYPEVFKKFQVKPPRGVLFHGPPGTGKTLIARALANECCFGSRKISFFMRKGADLLSKWIGESEKQLRLLFEQAKEMKPSIIFFDELDGLAPVRSSRQDQVHASIVSTLLALMDGLDDRGEVVIIGATNRVDSIDPALRRPGRFDRELHFPLPARKEREEILNVHMTQWSAKPSKELISYLAEHAVGYCGSDLRALCSEAVIQSFRRNYPQVYNANYKLALDPENVKVDKIDFLRAKSQLVPAAHRVAYTMGRKLLPILVPLLKKPLKIAMDILEKTFPHGVNPVLAKVKLSACFRPAQLLLTGNGPEHGQTTHLGPAILFAMEHIHAHVLDFTALYKDSGRSPEEACIQLFVEVRRNIPSVLYIPCIDHLWNLISETTRAIFISQLAQLDPNSPILLLATSNLPYEHLSDILKNIFSQYRKEVLQIEPPSEGERREFFKPLLIDMCLKPPKPPRVRPKTPPPLPKAPTPPPTPMTEEAAKKLFEQEERTLRELRIFLRDMCKKLANNKLFYMFTKPVDIEEVPDYPTIIKQPMDLETMMNKVDFHRYECARDFLDDIELIVQNALEYNPAKTSADKQIRHRACSLRDYAFTLIKKEMDSDFEEKCQEISKQRKIRKVNVSEYLPAYINTQATIDKPEFNPDLQVEEESNQNGQVEVESNESSKTVNGLNSSRGSPNKKRKLSWQKGNLQKKKKKKTSSNETLEELNEDKGSSADEVKENNSEDGEKYEQKVVISPSANSTEAKKIVNDMEKNSLENCDIEAACVEKASLSLKSPTDGKRRLSDLMSPSELLEDALDIDDIDQALDEISKTADQEDSQIKEIADELEKFLDQTVQVTSNHSLHSLLDLHFQFSRIIRNYSRKNNRKYLPMELRRELNRYKKEHQTPEDITSN